jgi:hypothetical protein
LIEKAKLWDSVILGDELLAGKAGEVTKGSVSVKQLLCIQSVNFLRVREV